MVYPYSIEDKIDFLKVKHLLKTYCLGDWAIKSIDALYFSNDFQKVKILLNQTYELKHTLETSGSFPLKAYYCFDPCIDKLNILESYILEEEFFGLIQSLLITKNCISFIKKNKESYNYLNELAAEVNVKDIPVQEINKCFDDQGLLNDNASDKLKQLRIDRKKNQKKIRRIIHEVLEKAKKQQIALPEALPTIRNGRMVIPLPSENKRKVKGFVHDQSATRKTVFLEPIEALEINNSLISIDYEEKEEIVRILKELTNLLRPYKEVLSFIKTFLGNLDFIHAKANLALRLCATLPKLVDKPHIEWHEAKHPFLFISHQKSKKPVVPLSFYLNSKKNILIISGPNAGGKSVVLKTVGLLQYMLQCGLLIPVREDSTAGIFQNLFVDLGDQQSIEKDLSTYSSHLTNMKFFLDHANTSTLFLIDEFGTGTEPSLGGALAETILEELHQKSSWGVVTTHYGNLKKLANRLERVENGAMRFDTKQLKPLYELEIGYPGSSYAFQIAKKIGLNDKLIKKAQEKIGSATVKFDILTSTLEQEKQTVLQQRTDIKQKKEQLETLITQYTQKEKALKEEKKQIINEARDQAQALVREANKKIEKTIKQIQENKAEKLETKKLRKDLKVFEKQLSKGKSHIKKGMTVESAQASQLKVGDVIKIKNQELAAEIKKIKEKGVEVAIGHLKSFIPFEKIEAKVSEKKPKPSFKKTSTFDWTTNKIDFSTSLDIRGLRSDVALSKVTQFVDQALIAQATTCRIVHGKGDGILKNIVSTILSQYPHPIHFEDEHISRGGSGVTVFTFQ